MPPTSLVRTALLAAAFLTGFAWTAARAEQESTVIVTVNDAPITNFDIDQRLRLWELLGSTKGDRSRKRALQSLIDDVIKISAAKKNALEAKEDVVDGYMKRMATSMQTDMKGLQAKLKKQGISLSALKQYATAQISFNRLLVGLYKVEVKVDSAEVDKAYAKFTSDPRLKPVTVYTVLEVLLPIEKSDQAMGQEIIYARAAEAQQVMQRFRGCGSARAAAEGVYNVVIRKPFEVDASKIPPPLKAALDKGGPGKLLGPAMQKDGIQLIALCDRKVMEPPKPSRQFVESMLENKKYESYEERYLRDLRRTAFIDYKDPSYSQ
jgi:peptidyl-prolyl cis-trans isomerase SurA